MIGAITFMGLAVTGCAGNRDAITKASITSRQDVFQQAQAAQPAAGQTLLGVDFPVKAFKSAFINTYTKNENPPYTVTINIDGQATVVAAEPVLEDLPGSFRDNPEAGTGWKYIFKSTLVLQPGKHHLTIAVPIPDVIIEKDIDLKAGENTLTLSPVYNSSASKYSRHPRFSQGLKSIAVKLNSQEL